MNASAPGRAHHQPPTPVPVRSSLLAGCAVVDQTSHQIVFHIPDIERRSEVALWCLRNGHRIVNPFAHADDPRLIIRGPVVFDHSNPASLAVGTVPTSATVALTTRSSTLRSHVDLSV